MASTDAAPIPRLHLAGFALLTTMLTACGSSSNSAGPNVSPPPPPPAPPANSAPVAAAGADKAVSATLAVSLDGTGSSDADGDPLTYAWSFTAVPAGSQSTFDDETAAQPVFTPDLAGDYNVELVVSDGTVTSAADQVLVSATDNTSRTTIGAAGGELTSTDGLMALSIPAGALSADEEIAITLVPPDQHDDYLGPEFDGLGGIESVYDFAPDGLDFIVPVTATLSGLGNPVVDSETLGGVVKLLVTSDGTDAIPMSEQSLVADASLANTSLSGRLNHFSPGLLYNPPTSPLNWRIAGVPDRLAPGQLVQVNVNTGSETAVLASASYSDPRSDPAFRPFDGPILSANLSRVGDASEFSGSFQYACTTAGAGGTTDYIATLSIVVSEEQPPGADPFLKGKLLVVSPGKSVTCEAGPPSGSSRLTPGLTAAPAGLTSLEAFMIGNLLQTIVLSGVGDVSSSPMALFAGAQGHVLQDLETGQVLVDRTDPARTDPLFGAVLASTAQGGGAAGMIYQFGAGTFGGCRYDYDETAQAFSTGCQLKSGTAFDANPVGNTHDTNQVVYTTDTRVGVLQYDPTARTYEYVDYPTGANDFLGGTPVSAAMSEASGDAGPAMLVTEIFGSTDLFRVEADGTATLQDTFFDEVPRKIRCLKTLCGISIFEDAAGDGRLRFVIWDGINAAVPVDTTVQVGAGPVGIDALELDNGNILWVSSGFRDNTVSLTEVTIDGVLVSNNTNPVPAGCESPGHTAFYKPTANPEEAQVAGTCFDSAQWFALDIVNDPTVGFTIVPLE